MFPNVALNIFVSSVMMGLLRNQHQLARPTNKEALDWYKQNLKNGKVSEEATKSEAVVFFNLSEDKATISQRPKNLGSRVALLPGKFLRIRKVFAHITEKPDNCLDHFPFPGWFQNCPEFSRSFPIFRTVSKLCILPS